MVPTKPWGQRGQNAPMTSSSANPVGRHLKHTGCEARSPLHLQDKHRITATFHTSRPHDKVLSDCRAKTKNPEEGNSVVELYIQIGTDDLAKRSLLDMVDQVSPRCTLFAYRILLSLIPAPETRL